jgi:magnesium chelatase subunit D
MTEPPARDPAEDSGLAALLFAVDPSLGAVVRADAGPVRDAWIARLRAALPAAAPWRRVPPQIGDDRLLGGIDLAATLQAGRPVAARGVLAEADGGVVVLAMAERISAQAAGRIGQVLDTGTVTVARDGMMMTSAARIGVVALDEGIGEEAAPAALRDRLALHVSLPARDTGDAVAANLAAARARLDEVSTDDAVISALCEASRALGIGSLRAPVLALRAARAHAALMGRADVTDEDAAVAARLVLGPRAKQMPAPAETQADEAPAQEPGTPDAPDPAEASSGSDEATPEEVRTLEDVVLEAARAALPADMLAGLRAMTAPVRASAPGKAGATRAAARRGRPIGTRRGDPGPNARLDLIETLRGAAPWQRLRPRAEGRIAVRREDFRVRRFRERTQTLTVFALDASGSAALHRLAEAKGAVELLLAECYVRRDCVAVLAFRGQAAELVLPPTRSLARARRSLAGLPGGGPTPLACGIDAAASVADAARRRGQTPVIVLLTDGRANIGRDGKPGRAQAAADATSAAQALRAQGFSALLVDTSPQPQETARRLAAEMGAPYLPLPYADAAALTRAAQMARPS